MQREKFTGKQPAFRPSTIQSNAYLTYQALSSVTGPLLCLVDVKISCVYNKT